MSNTDTSAAAPKAKRTPATKREWIMRDGAVVKDPREADGVQIDVLGADRFQGFPRDYSPGIQNALALFGLNIVLTNTMGGKRGQEAWDDLEARAETLANGEWTSRAGGPRISRLVDAVVAAYAEAGRALEREKVEASIKDGGEERREELMKNAAIRKHYDRLTAEAAAERAAKSAEGAEGAALPDMDFAGAEDSEG